MIAPGTMLGSRYRLEERIASGGMGDVWRAVDDVLGRTVAAKILLSALMDDPGFAERFRVEARTMATVNHPGVVDIYDYGSDPAAGAYLVMEYVEGDALSRTLARVGRLTPARTMSLIAQAAEALHAAHERGIVHRDVKPGNLLVRPNGTLVLTDFGIARSAGAAQLTAAGSVLGTASYISPEQAMGQPATPLSDIYALGVVAYQCLAGRRPFEGDNPLDIAMRHVREAPPPLPPDIPPSVRAIVERAIAKDPAGRWPDAAAFAAVARRAASALVAGARPAGVAPPGSPSRPGAMRVAPGVAPAPPGVGRAPGPMPGSPITPTPASPAPAGRGQPASGYPHGNYPRPTPGGGTSRSSVVVAVIVAILIVVVCFAGAFMVARLGKLKNLGSPGQDLRYGLDGSATMSARLPDTTSAAFLTIDRQRPGEHTYRRAEVALEGRGSTIDNGPITSAPPAGRVVGLPCRAVPGSEATVKVSSGERPDAAGGAQTGALMCPVYG